MCRFAVYVSPQKPILLADLLTRPKHSIVKQSYGCTERTVQHEIPAALNADGFGVAWYPVKSQSNNNSSNSSDIDMEGSCLFRSVLPAWNDTNLHRISAKIESSLIFAHVRAASPGSGISQPNCHPFVCGKYTFMHNGGIEAFSTLKKHLVMQLSSDLYRNIAGATDSEHAFMSFMMFLSQMTPSNRCSATTQTKTISTIQSTRSSKVVEKLSSKSIQSHSSTFVEPKVLLKTMKRTIINILYLQKKLKIQGDSNLNFAVSDGNTTLVSRVYLSYKIDDDDDGGIDHEESKEPEKEKKGKKKKKKERKMKGGKYTDLSKGASLYFSCGSTWAKCSDNEYRMRHTNMLEDVVIIASERLSMCHEDWVEVPRNHIVVVTNKTNVLLFPMDIEQELANYEAEMKSVENVQSNTVNE